jgi:hypothetical protein
MPTPRNRRRVHLARGAGDHGMVVSRGLAMVVVGEAVAEDMPALEEMRSERKTWPRLANPVVLACWALVLMSVVMVGTEAAAGDDVAGREVVGEGQEVVEVVEPRELLLWYVIVWSERHHIVWLADTLSFCSKLSSTGSFQDVTLMFFSYFLDCCDRARTPGLAGLALVNQHLISPALV